LCVYSGDMSNEMEVVLRYIVDTIGTVADGEIYRQVVEMLAGCEPPIVTSVAEVQRHVQEHMLEQRVVLVRVLKDLLHVNQRIKEAATCERVLIVEREDDAAGIDTDAQSTDSDVKTTQQIVDPKAMAVYLKTIDQITSIYKMPSMMRLNTSGGGGSAK